MGADSPSGPQRFPTTPWSLVALAARRGDQCGREALGQLLARYLPALRAHLVYGKRLAPDRADDLLQDFVAGKMLERDLVARADRELGKFRTFLLTSLDRFLLNRLRDAGARKRAAGEAAEALGDQAEQLAGGGEAPRAFDVAWARSVLAEALRRMRKQCESAGRTELWSVFEERVLAPALEGAQPTSYDALVKRFGFQSPSQASNVLATAKRMYARALRAVIGEYARHAEEIEEEIEQLRAILGGAPRTHP